MADYRVYLVNRMGRIQTGQDFTCDDQKDVISFAKRNAQQDCQVQVWLGTKRIAVIDGPDGSSAPGELLAS